MEFRTLANGVKMPVLGYGVAQVHGAEATQAVKDAIANGYRMIDTAVIYDNEGDIGRAIAESDVDRRDLFLTTKVWVQDMSYEGAKASVSRSSELLGTDYLDLVLLHHPIGDIWGAWRALEEAYKAGRIRAIGVSNFSPALMTQFVALNDIAPMVNQIENHPFHQQADKVAYFQEQGILVEAWAPFAEGMHDVFHSPILTKIAENHDKEVGHVILRWLLQRGISTIPKSMKPARMASNLDVFDFELATDEMAQIATMNTGETLFGGSDDPDVAHVQKMLNWTVTH
ncbi:aldo/keto reductase [Weissella confusa]|uniref:aldo/keto reductase n=1 Tax=Weissella confusa TaxID=1583 RepID=UPI00223C2CBD|nr:aldo/keto reductase [Weissella confusa]MCS9990415.1 aldo/keto reductase [Weissella confusa]